MNPGCLEPDEIVAFADGKADPDARARVREHLVACATCRQTFAASQDLAKPLAIGRFELIERVGAGATGVVYAARDPQLDRRAALKILRADRWTPEASRRRLIREARLLAKVDHPNVVTIYDAGEVGDDVFIAMELVSGQPLHVWRRERHPSPAEILEVFRQAALGLAAAHAVGVVHRDFKPANVLVGSDGRVRVADFGLASTEADAPIDAGSEPPAHTSRDDLSRSGMFIGTPAYMSPEQRRGERADAASDQFAFCVALVEALAGERVVPPRVDACPPWIRPLLARGLAAEPGARFPSMRALVAELETAPRRRARRRRAAAIGAGAALVTGGLAFALFTLAREPPMCGNPQEQLQRIWSVQARAAIATKYAGASSLAPLLRELDGYAEAWTAMRASACTATRVDGDQSEHVMDLRMRCLDQRRSEFRQLTDALLDARDPHVIHGAVTAVHQLVDVQTCADIEALTEAVPPPHAPELRAAVDRVRDELARASALAWTGEYSTSLEIAEGAARQAERLAYRPLLGHAQYTLGHALHRMGKAAEAERAFRAAAEAAAEARDDLLAARAWLQLVDVVAGDRSRAQEITALADFARTATVRAGNSIGEQEALLGILSRAALSTDRHREALDHAERRLALVERVSDPVLEVAALDDLASVLSKMGRYDDAERHARRALPLAERHLGEMHPTMASLWVRIGNAEYHRNRIEEAERAYLNALAVWTTAIGEETPMLATIHTSLGGCAAALGRFADAARSLTRGLEIAKAVYGPEHPEVAVITNDLAILQLRRGEHRAGIALLEQALATWRTILPANDSTVIGLLINLGLAHGNLGEHAAAERYCREALAAMEASGRDIPHLAPVLNCIGNEMEKSGRPGPARPVLERALALDPAHPMLRAEIEFGLARALVDVDRARAATLARRAHAAFVAGGEPSADSAHEVARWQARHRLGGAR